MTETLYISFVILLAAALLVPSTVFLAMSFSHPGMRYWRFLFFGYASLFLASILAATRDLIPSVFSIPISNVLVGIGYFICLRAFSLIEKGTVSSRIESVVLIFYSIAVFIVYFLSNEYSLRVTLISACICFYSLLVSKSVLKMRENLNTLGVWLVLVASVFNIFLSGMRTLAAWLGSDNYALSLQLWDTVFFIGSIGILFSFSIGQFIIGSAILAAQTENQLAHQRNLTKKLNNTLEDQRNLQKLLIHEIKRPINSISSILQSYDQDIKRQENPFQYTSLSKFVNEAKNSLETIGDYEDLSDLFEQPRFVKVPLENITRDLRSKWRIAVSVQKSKLPYQLNVDPFLLDVALGNLVENGQKFGRTREGVVIRISEHADYLVFDVEDDGAGIPESEWSRVWGKFYRVNSSPQNPISGCGLGLHAVKEIAEVHHGYASVLSKLPSTIRFAVPLSQKGDSYAER